MADLSLSSPSVDFGTCATGPQPAQYVLLTVGVETPFAVTITADETNGAGFVGTLCSKYEDISVHGQPTGVQESDGATTSGASGTTNTQTVSAFPGSAGSGP